MQKEPLGLQLKLRFVFSLKGKLNTVLCCNYRTCLSEYTYYFHIFMLPSATSETKNEKLKTRKLVILSKYKETRPGFVITYNVRTN